MLTTELRMYVADIYQQYICMYIKLKIPFVLCKISRKGIENSLKLNIENNVRRAMEISYIFFVLKLHSILQEMM